MRINAETRTTSIHTATGRLIGAVKNISTGGYWPHSIHNVNRERAFSLRHHAVAWVHAAHEGTLDAFYGE